MLDKKNSYEGLYVYHQKDIQMISYLKQKGSGKNGTTEQDEQGSENAV